MFNQLDKPGVTKCLLLPMWGVCHFCCFCWCCAVSELSVLRCSQHPESNYGTYLGYLVGSAASYPWHLQGFVLLWHALLLLLLQGIWYLGQAQQAYTAF
jgi:hypothetical protein